MAHFGVPDPLRDLACVFAGAGANGFLELNRADPREAELAQTRARADEVFDKFICGVRQDLVGGVVLHDLAADVEDDDPVAEFDGLVEVVRDEDDRLVEFGLDMDKLVLETLAGDGIHGAEWLVHEEDRRVRGEGACHADALLLASRELLGVTAAIFAGFERNEVQKFVDAFGYPLLVPSEEFGDDGDVFSDRHMREEASCLDDVADVAAQFVAVHLRDVVAVDDDAAGCGLDEPVDHLQRRRFAAPRRADEHDCLAGGDFKREMVYCGLGAAVVLRHLLQDDRGAGD